MKNLRTLILTALAALSAAQAHAQATPSMTAYIGSLLVSNTNGDITNEDVQNAILVVPNNLSTISYTGHVSTTADITTTATVHAGHFVGDCSGCTGIPGSTTPTAIINGSTNATANASTVSFTISGVQQALINSTGLIVSGTVSGTHFVGDGSGLTGVGGGTPQAIVSGTSNVTANTAGTVSVTTAGSTITWFTSNGLITNGVSATGTVSGTLFSGSGAGLSNLPSPSWFDIQPLTIPPQLIALSNSAVISVSGLNVTNVTGTRITATNFFGNGSNLTGIGASNPSWTSIVRSTVPPAVIAISDSTGSITVTSVNASGTSTFGTISVGACSGCTVGTPTNISTTQNAAGNVSKSIAVGFQALVGTGLNNTAFGTNTLQAATTGGNNTAMGALALSSNNTNLTDNTAIGYQALQLNSASFNTAVGSQALATYNNANVINSMAAFGYGAMSNVVLGGSDVAIGTNAGSGAASSNVSVTNSVFVGAGAGVGISSSTGNTFIGNKAGLTVTTGSNNLLLGANTAPLSNTGSGQLNIANALWGNIGSGVSNTNLIGINVTSPSAALEVSGTVSATALHVGAITASSCSGCGGGATALTGLSDVSISYPAQNMYFGLGTGNIVNGASNTTGDANTGVGFGTLGANTSGFNNTAIGTDTLINNTVGSNNTVVGSAAYFGNGGSANTIVGASSYTNGTGISNTTLGYFAGRNLTTGSYNIAIGDETPLASAGGSNQMNIGNSLFGFNINNGNTARIGINTPGGASFALEVSGTVAFDSLANNAGSGPVCYNSSTHAITTNTAACTVSDMRLKTNIEPFDDALDTVMQLQVRQFDWRDPAMYGAQHQVGFIAQEVEQVIPAVVGTGDDGSKSLSYDKLSAYAIGAIQEQQATIVSLTARIEALEKK